MRKIVICNIPMKERIDQTVYSSDDKSLPVADWKVRYPINAFLKETLKPYDELKVLLLVKKDIYTHYKKNSYQLREKRIVDTNPETVHMNK